MHEPLDAAVGRALSGIARTGLGFTKSLYERERFEEVLRVAADIRVAAMEESGAEALFDEWISTVGEGVGGYITPRCAVAAVVGNDEGELLLTQRADSGIWLYPVGWADVGYSPSEVAVKEVFEETGIEVEPVSLIALRRSPARHAHLPLYSLASTARMLGGGSPAIHSGPSSGYFARISCPSWPGNRWPIWPSGQRQARPSRGLEAPRTPPWRGIP
jgi:ADP-ribose pyrophosphatase YjhB (NUDIX family)